jgi:hypothetical protein
LEVSGESFVLTTPEGKRLSGEELAGATLTGQAPDGSPLDLRIDSATPAPERSSLMLLGLSVRDLRTGQWTPMCEPDAKGRRAGFPIAGAWDGAGRFVGDAHTWFISCTSGSQAKCVLWGYDPWSRGPHGEDLRPYYEACQHLVRADYDGRGQANTKNGTAIDVWDHIGVQTRQSPEEPGFRFEAGWAPAGAACVAKTRWADLLTLGRLRQGAPRLGGACDETIATSRGALIFNSSR